MPFARLLSFLVVIPLLAADAYLFTSFRKNGETGVFLALSRDGKQWSPLNGNKAWIPTEKPGELMRDPFLTQGPDGVWHMIWTWGWNRKDTGGRLVMGHSSSKDLITWGPHEQIEVMQDQPNAGNAWAPEAAWNPKTREWVIFWATTIREAQASLPSSQEARGGPGHRIFATTTKDWKTFTPAKLWFDPGFSSIDSTLVNDGNRWIMIFKDERVDPPQKNLKLAFADSPSGPWRDVTESFTKKAEPNDTSHKTWVEGPSAVKIGDFWWIYYDHYASPRHYGAMRTLDWKNFEEMTSQLNFPEDHRHGTVVKIPDELAKKLEKVNR